MPAELHNHKTLKGKQKTPNIKSNALTGFFGQKQWKKGNKNKAAKKLKVQVMLNSEALTGVKATNTPINQKTPKSTLVNIYSAGFWHNNIGALDIAH